MRACLVEIMKRLIRLVRRLKLRKAAIRTRIDQNAVPPMGVRRESPDSRARRRVLESICDAGSTKAKPGVNAAASQDFLYDGRGLP